MKVRVAGLKKSKVGKARELRRNITDAERKLWSKLRNRQLANLKFRRQYPLGPYFLDFYCPSKHFVIEVDGGQHYTSDGQVRDRSREKYLKRAGLEMLRYSDTDVLINLDYVLQDILNAIKDL
jgi:very-short-patch-repair endonuclease